MNYCYLPNLEASYNSVSRHSGFFNPIKYLSFVPNIKQKKKKKKNISESGRTDTSAFCFTSSPEAHSHLPFVPWPYDVTFCFNKGYRLSLHVLSITCMWAAFELCFVCVCVCVSFTLLELLSTLSAAQLDTLRSAGFTLARRWKGRPWICSKSRTRINEVLGPYYVIS